MQRGERNVGVEHRRIRMKRGGQILFLHVKMRGRRRDEGDATGILRAGEREERGRILIREEKDGGNVIHQTGRGRKGL